MKKLALHGGTPVRTAPYPAWPVSGPREEDLLRKVLFQQQWGGYNEHVALLEELFAGVHDARYGIACANGSLALELVLAAAGVGPGDEVVVPAHSFIATATAVSRVGAKPVFVDIDRQSFNLDLIKAEKALGLSSKVVLVVHFAGLMCDMEELSRIAAQKGVRIIEDAAHAHGAEWNGQRAGGGGWAGTFSFQNSKAMTAGEGGMVLTSDPELAAKARSLANGGRRSDGGWFEHFELGSNFRLSGLQAAVLLAQLDRLPEQIRLRTQNAAILREELVKIPGVRLQELPAAATSHTHYLLPGWIDEQELGASRDDFVAALQAEGVPVRPFYPHPLYRNPVYQDKKRNLPKRLAACPVAEAASKDSFWLPQNALMGTEEDTRDIVRAVEKIHDAYKPPKPSAKPN